MEPREQGAPGGPWIPEVVPQPVHAAQQLRPRPRRAIDDLTAPGALVVPVGEGEGKKVREGVRVFTRVYGAKKSKCKVLQCKEKS